MDISNQFIDQLFNHQRFRQCLESTWTSFSTQSIQPLSMSNNIEIESVTEEISEFLSLGMKSVISIECNHLYESNRQILEQLSHLKSQLHSSPHLKTESSTAERDTRSTKLQTSIFFDNDDQYDMKEIRKHFQQSEIENKILVNSFEIDQQQRTYIDQEIEDRINASVEGSINRIQLTLEEKFDKYSAKIEQRVEQLRKTIASVVEAMNEKEFWQNQMVACNSSKAFSKKQPTIKSQQKHKQNHASIINQDPQQDTQKNHPIQKHPQPLVQVTNPQKQKQKSPNHHIHQTNQIHANNSNKAMESLNKSINLGRSKIKSLFGFKSGGSSSAGGQQQQGKE